MKSMTYGILPSRVEFEAAFETQCADGYAVRLNGRDADILDWVGTVSDSHGTWDVDEAWETLALLTNCFNEGDPYASEYAGNLASCILETLGFEWI